MNANGSNPQQPFPPNAFVNPQENLRQQQPFQQKPFTLHLPNNAVLRAEMMNPGQFAPQFMQTQQQFIPLMAGQYAAMGNAGAYSYYAPSQQLQPQASHAYQTQIIPTIAGQQPVQTVVSATPTSIQHTPQAQSLNPAPKRERKIISIIDPNTKKDIIAELDAQPKSLKDQQKSTEGADSSSGSFGEAKTDDGVQRFMQQVMAAAIDKPSDVSSEATTVAAAAATSDKAVKGVLPSKDVTETTNTEKINNVEVKVKTEAAVQGGVANLVVADAAEVPPSTPVTSVEENSSSTANQPASTESGVESAISTPIKNGVLPLESSMESKIKQFEDEMSTFLEDSAERANIDDKIYSSQFLYFMQKIVAELKIVNCPKSESELKDIGIDKATMPVTMMNKLPKKIENSKDTFAPVWQPTGNTRINTTRPPYAGRHTDNSKPMRKKQPIITRGSQDRRNIEPAPLLHRKAENAWKPRREEKMNDANAEQIRQDKVRKEVRGLLNKITPSTYDTLKEEFSTKVADNPQMLSIIIDLIFDKAVEEPRFCPIYSQLCRHQVTTESTQVQTFRTAIITKSQNTFINTTSFDEEIESLNKQIEEETDAAKKSELIDKMESLKSKEKRRLLGVIKFVSELYRQNLLIDQIINWCVVELVKRFDTTHEDVYIEYAVEMIETVGATYDKKRASQQQAGNATTSADECAIDKIVFHLSTIKDVLTNRVRFMIMNLEDLKRNNWKPRHGLQGPKTMDEVRNEAEQEQLVNQQEREAYEQKIASREQNTKKGSRSYMGRGSTDNRVQSSNSSDKRAAAVAASNMTGSSGMRKDTTLRQYENQSNKLSHSSWFQKNKIQSSTPPPQQSSVTKEDGGGAGNGTSNA